jgi:hypothetical protein
MTDLEQQLTDHLRERAAAATPHYDLEAVEAGLSSYAPVDLDERRRRRLLIPAVVGVAAAVALVVAIAVVRQVQDRDAATPVTEPDQGRMTTFVSTRHGFSFEYPAVGEVTVMPATDLWDPRHEDGPGVDVVETGSGAAFTGASLSLVPVADPGESMALDGDFIADVFEGLMSARRCGPPLRQQEEITIDGHPGRIAECPNEIRASVVAGERIYQFSLLHDRSDARADFDTFAATIRLTPETALDFPELTNGRTFVSPTNGFSAWYQASRTAPSDTDDGGPGPGGGEGLALTPATELWDPARGEQRDAFDYIETGYGAGFQGASTEIPDGVTIDEWVDTVVVKFSDDALIPRSTWEQCMVPRSQQEVITIDGQSGRVVQCPDELVATVIAGGRLYQFSMGWLGTRDDARAFFDAWVATIDLTPETAAVP